MKNFGDIASILLDLEPITEEVNIENYILESMNNGTQENIKERTIQAWKELSEMISSNPSISNLKSEQNDDLTKFEMLFYQLLFLAYLCERNLEEPDIDILAESIIPESENNDSFFQYLQYIYEAMQIMFRSFLAHRNAWRIYIKEAKPILLKYLGSGIDPKKIEKTIKNFSENEIDFVRRNPKVNGLALILKNETGCDIDEAIINSIYEGEHYSLCQMDRFSVIQELLQKAIIIYPKGEIANRFMFISDAIKNCSFVIDKPIPDFSVFEKYTNIRNGFFRECFPSQLADTEIAPRAAYYYEIPPEAHMIFKNGQYLLDNEEQDEQGYLRMAFNHFFFQPAYIAISYINNEFAGKNVTYAFNPIITGILMQRNNILLEDKNKALKKAQDDKKQIIAEFAHTYGNMRATTLQDIGTELLSTDDDLLHEWGRKVMVEYAIKEELTKEVEMLKLQFEDETTALIQKLKDSISDTEGKDITGLISDALQRCFMSVLYGETRADKSKRKLFFGIDNYADQRAQLQEEFEQDVLVNQTDMLTWISENHILIIPVNISGLWNKLRFDNGGYAALLITNWITELLSNAMKYADKSKPISLSFGQQDDTLVFEICNTREQTARNIHGTQQGISAICASIRRLNLAVNDDSETDHALDQSDDMYHLRLYLSSHILIE